MNNRYFCQIKLFAAVVELEISAYEKMIVEVNRICVVSIDAIVK